MTGPQSSLLQHAKAVLFDLDGTLLDSFQSHYRVYQRVFGDLRISFDENTFARHYSPNWYLLYERIGLPRERWPHADQLWLRYYAQEEPEPYEGASSVLALVKRSGRALGLVTSGERFRVEQDLDRLGWRTLFGAIVCGGDTPYRKPHPAPLQAALEHLDLSPPTAAYVGDTVEDVQMGKAAGTATVAVSGRFTSAEALRAEAPDLLVDSLQGLKRLLKVTSERRTVR